MGYPDQQWKKLAFSQQPRPVSGLEQIPGYPTFSPNEHGENVTSYTIHVGFTEWYQFDHINAKPDLNVIWGTEL